MSEENNISKNSTGIQKKVVWMSGGKDVRGKQYF